ncbi:MAG: LLM class flavin-dependent oxidoreductase [Dehalococcoidia bacterium]|uniref:LLM class flavin-dependent oxidoreductase n=1 Tax=Candidatus Amarobacter glycogenicus TaxID=3140699 RepID=UPI0031370829|nr:LLM class flavin-dependent oxidoreductase [Dehalococcoidia bacterium]MBK7330191.1 LLM class flavin-dependent oxidoreductase [Dehalococcoidia bacterium]
MANKPRYWGTLSPLPAQVITAQAQQFESMGLEGVFAPQVYGPPFIPLAVAAGATTRLKLASGIALAFARSPFETAVAAMDMDTVSNGRFVLGLGSSVRSWSEGFFGMPYGKPVEHLREVIEIVRLVIQKSHTGELGRYDGKYHQLDFSEFQPLRAPVRTDLPIWVAGLRQPILKLGAEVADGVIGHPIWSIEWATTKVIDDISAGLAKAGRKRSDIEFNVWLFVAPNNDRKQAIEDAKATVAFYAGVEQYEAYFAAHGFGKEARLLQEGVKRGDYLGVKHLVPDEMAQTFVVCGTPDEVRARVAKVWEVADSACLNPPIYALEPEQVMAYGMAIAQLFYT